MNHTKRANVDNQVQPNAWRKFFATPLIVAGLAAGDNTPATFQPTDADFWILQLTGIVRDAGAVTVISNPKVSVQFTDSNNTYPLFGGNPMQLPNITGTAQLPFVLPLSYVLSKQCIITATFTNNEAVAIDIEVGLVGFKHFEGG